MTLLTLEHGRVTGDDERNLLLGVQYDADADRHLDEEGEIVDERDRYDDQILAGLVFPW